MHKLLTALTAAAAMGFCVSVAQADCYGGHNVTASTDQTQQSVAMSTYDGPIPTTVRDDASKPAAAAACAEGDKDCTPVRK
jgi:hypothetical protein